MKIKKYLRTLEEYKKFKSEHRSAKKVFSDYNDHLFKFKMFRNSLFWFAFLFLFFLAHAYVSASSIGAIPDGEGFFYFLSNIKSITGEGAIPIPEKLPFNILLFSFVSLCISFSSINKDNFHIKISAMSMMVVYFFTSIFLAVNGTSTFVFLEEFYLISTFSILNFLITIIFYHLSSKTFFKGKHIKFFSETEMKDLKENHEQFEDKFYKLKDEIICNDSSMEAALTAYKSGDLNDSELLTIEALFHEYDIHKSNNNQKKIQEQKLTKILEKHNNPFFSNHRNTIDNQ